MEDRRKNRGKYRKYLRNKISCLLIGFFFGSSILYELTVDCYLSNQKQFIQSYFIESFTLVKIPFLFTPIFGLITDFLPLFRYRRKVYLYICSILNLCSWSLFAMILPNISFISTTCFVLVNCSLSFISVLGQSILVEIIKSNFVMKNLKENIPMLMAHYYLAKHFGTLIVSIIECLNLEIKLEIMFMTCKTLPFLVFFSAIVLYEDKIEIENEVKNYYDKKQMSEQSLIIVTSEQKRTTLKDLIKNKRLVIILVIVVLLESCPLPSNVMDVYENNILQLTPRKEIFIDLLTELSSILFITLYKEIFYKYYFKKVIYISSTLIFLNFSFYLFFIIGLTQKYISNFTLICLVMFLHSGFTIISRLTCSFLAMILSPKSLEGTAQSLLIFCFYFGNIVSQYFEDVISKYYNISQSNLKNPGRIVFIVNLLNIIPLIILYLIPEDYFLTNIKITCKKKFSKKFLEDYSSEEI